MTIAEINLLLPKSQILTATDGARYEKSLLRWSNTGMRRAKYIVLPKNSREVSETILFASSHDLEIAIKGGGHSCSGASSSEGLVIDLKHLKSVVVDAEKQLVTVGGGTLWEAVDEEVSKYGLATVGGTVGHTGVGGLTVGGGYGWLSPKYGLVIDNLVEAEMVLSTGEIIVCNETRYANLFWAIRGAGSNFGPVTSFVFKAHPQPNLVWSGMLIFAPSKLEHFVKATENWFQDAGENEGAMLLFACPSHDLKPALVLLPFYNGSAKEGKKKFREFYDVGPMADTTEEMPYARVNTLQNPTTTHGDRKLFKTTKFTLFNPSHFQHLFDEYSKLIHDLPETSGSTVIVELYSHDKILAVHPTATAFANRARGCSMLFTPRWKDPQLDSRLRSWAADQVRYVREHEGAQYAAASSQSDKHNNITNGKETFQGSDGYSNYGCGDERPHKVFGGNYDRLVQLKAQYDPNNLFHKWFPITPTPKLS